MSSMVRRGPCDKCGSSDGNTLYDDGHWYCFVCSAYTPGEKGRDAEEDDEVNSRQLSLVPGTFQFIKNRGISEAVCRKYGYAINKERKLHIANYRVSQGDAPVAQKLRGKDKDFTITGDGKAMGFFGQHLWAGGRSVVITEGELDALSYGEEWSNKGYAAVSLPKGAKGAAKAIKEGYDWLSKFETIYLSFDMDEAGRAAVKEAAPLCPSVVKIIELPRKDANEVLLNEPKGTLTRAYYDAKVWRPDGIVAGEEITLESLKKATATGFSIPYTELNEKLKGVRKRELLLLTAGSGIGKSTLARELAYHLRETHGLTIGNIFLEESKEKTAQAYIAIDRNVPLGKLRADPNILTDAQWQVSYDNVVADRMYFYDHFGSLDSDRLLQKMRYMVKVLGCDFLILDHISIVISGQQSSSEGERRDIDMLMTNLRSLVEETGVGVIAIVHLKQPEGTAHEEGGRVTLSHLRGSGSLKQLPDAIVALERNQQSEDDPYTSTIRLLKNREHGDVGVAGKARYDKETGRLLPVSITEFEDM